MSFTAYLAIAALGLIAILLLIILMPLLGRLRFALMNRK